MEKQLTEAFRACDLDNSGKLDLKEIKEVLKLYYQAVGEKITQAQVDDIAQKILTAIDKDGDGTISLEEFLSAMKD